MHNALVMISRSDLLKQKLKLNYKLVVRLHKAHNITVSNSFHIAIPRTSPDQTVETIVGSTLTLMVDITGFNLPLTSITWMEDGQVLMNNTDNIIITHGSFEAPPTTSALVRDPILSPMDNGTYEVTVVNPAGENMATYTIIVNGN